MTNLGNGNGRTSHKAEHRGLLKLMLKLPAMRGRLQIVAASSRSLADIFEAYEEASEMLERLRQQGNKADSALLAEYENVCSEIESDVIRYCLDEHRHVLK
jgi:hypothetical protein